MVKVDHVDASLLMANEKVSSEESEGKTIRRV